MELPASAAAPGLHLCVGRASHPGRVRTRNEDSSLCLLATQTGELGEGDFGLFIVADGMGGQQEGQWAADMAARTVAQALTVHVYLPALEGNARDASALPVQEALLDALQAANQAVHHRLPDSGTTLTAALVRGGQVYLAHVGDSRAYLVHGGRLQRLTRDHSLVQRLHELGQLSTSELPQHPQRNVLYRAIGQGDGLEVDVARHALPRGARLLLCCDGLWGAVDEARIAELAGSGTPQEACDRLVAAALEAGGPDNITAVLVEATG